MKKILSTLIVIFGFGFIGEAAVQTEVVGYKHGKVKLEGFLAYDDSIKGKRPGVLVVHEWWGHGDYVRGRAKQLAELGYVAFALDMYGKGVYADTHEKAAELSGLYRKDRKLIRSRARVGLDLLMKNKLTDKKCVAAIGYCFGGSTVLELARAGLALAGVVTFHGGLGTPHPEKTKNVKAKILVNHGGNDGFTSAEQIAAFQKEMNDAGADWQMNIYAGAVHGFTVKAAGDDPSTGMAYNEKADKRSWAAMRSFFDEIF